MDDDAWVVLKFGGTSVASPTGWQTIAQACDQVLATAGHVLVVCSALSGVSNLLESLIETASEGGETHQGVAKIRAKHIELAAKLDVPLPDEVSAILEDLDASLQGIAMLRDASPRVRARLMAMGELMSTTLGASWLAARKEGVHWTDARTLLDADVEPEAPEGRRYLSATVSPTADLEARRTLAAHKIVVTQGFIASDDQGDTVLLGRGGSDTSAAYLAVVLAAERLEIWTDVPGLFTANPQAIADARHLDTVGYDEVAAMASLGARVLHPRCVGPVAEAGIPLHVRSTYMPEEAGTVVANREGEPGIKAVTARKGLVLLRMCRPSQWQPIGFVADISACFKSQGLSIDMMSTSPSTIAVTVDPASAPNTSLEALLLELDKVCDVTVEEPIASVSLVGTGVRDAFDAIGGTIHRLDGLRVEMVVQGAADHHLSFVVAESVANDLVRALHRDLFEGAIDHVGPTWRQLDSPTPPLGMTA